MVCGTETPVRDFIIEEKTGGRAGGGRGCNAVVLFLSHLAGLDQQSGHQRDGH